MGHFSPGSKFISWVLTSIRRLKDKPSTTGPAKVRISRQSLCYIGRTIIWSILFQIAGRCEFVIMSRRLERTGDLLMNSESMEQPSKVPTAVSPSPTHTSTYLREEVAREFLRRVFGSAQVYANGSVLWFHVILFRVLLHSPDSQKRNLPCLQAPTKIQASSAKSGTLKRMIKSQQGPSFSDQSIYNHQ